ncbi:EH signature domain-containing protein, partial [Acidocella sp.]|uniref:EH signature domain-containing protein n=1 Tax=Acidocella sp. TaxID=50710 RepID=UPI002618B6A3
MDHLENTRNKLEEVNRLVLNAFQVSVLPTKKILAEIWSIFDGMEREAPAQTAIEEAIIAYRVSGMIKNARQTKLLCAGITSTLFRDGSILEHPDSFWMLIEAVDGLKTKATQYRRCYFALMTAYFNYNRDDPGLACWSKLKDYLKCNSDFLKDLDRKPEWAALLLKNLEVFEENPGVYYGRKILENGRDHFDVLVNGLSIQPNSWLVMDTIIGQVKVTASYSDERFKSLIGMMLELLTEHRTALTEGLAILLTRYRSCKDHPVYPVLRDIVIQEWGNPFLSSNIFRWRKVDEQTRSMVSDWLKLEIIQAFFDLLSQDGNNNRRRFNFWSKYVKQISDMYFVLGRNALSDPREDFVKLRAKMGERLFRLSHGQSADNAFIMRFGRYAIIELGQHGNATYIFEWDKLPFELRPDVSVNRADLRSDKHLLRLHHRTVAGADWEIQYSTKLYTQLSIREDSYVPSLTGVSPSYSNSGRKSLLSNNHQDRVNALIDYCK